VLLALILILIPVAWLAVAALAVAACRSASRADRIAAREGDRRADGPPASRAAHAGYYGFTTSQGV
jgi:hypothetical protein